MDGHANGHASIASWIDGLEHLCRNAAGRADLELYNVGKGKARGFPVYHGRHIRRLNEVKLRSGDWYRNDWKASVLAARGAESAGCIPQLKPVDRVSLTHRTESRYELPFHNSPKRWPTNGGNWLATGGSRGSWLRRDHPARQIAATTATAATAPVGDATTISENIAR